MVDLRSHGRPLYGGQSVSGCWPFVIASMLVRQEGLDFHTHSHAIVRWNLPGNPVDLE